uniref:Kinesin-like protein KIN-7D, mitochondrial n=1 Tax=Tanacetum cinerariifolium TaxID=118510 RepID=A0A6L2KDW0_TANCI|nr:kinesin-like protein KIN-7D, mitochondrial [Tanacetum cinerariifolium]
MGDTTWFPSRPNNAESSCLCCSNHKVFGEYSGTQEVYDVAVGPHIRVAMDDVDGTVIAYDVTSSRKTHTTYYTCKYTRFFNDVAIISYIIVA